jgi:hemerythrin-like domain-containing protein
VPEFRHLDGRAAGRVGRARGGGVNLARSWLTAGLDRTGGTVNALTLLKSDHDELKQHLEAGEDTTERGVKTRAGILDTVTTLLTAHERIEEEIFYPALKAHPNAKDIVLEGYQEHHVVDLIVAELNDMPENDERWGAKFAVLKENIEHHIEEEEGEMFAKARKVFSEEELEILGERMERLKNETLTSRLTSHR